MESLSQITGPVRLPLNINVPPYLMDHRFQGKAVLPAVEAMEILAASTRVHFPGTDVRCIGDARFDKFLPIDEGCHRISAYHDLEVLDDGAVVSRLITKTRSKKAMITRTLEHATLCFRNLYKDLDPPSWEIPVVPVCHVPAETIYGNLVPFGPGYHNLKDGVTLSGKGAMGQVYAPPSEGSPILLGSPFPLDAAFHAACVWGQRYAGLVGFPVGFGLRRVFSPTRPGNAYNAVIFPKKVYSDRLLVDIRITDMEGVLREAVLDVVMKDVSRGRMKPPSWFAREDSCFSRR